MPRAWLAAPYVTLRPSAERSQNTRKLLLAHLKHQRIIKCVRLDSMVKIVCNDGEINGFSSYHDGKILRSDTLRAAPVLLLRERTRALISTGCHTSQTPRERRNVARHGQARLCSATYRYTAESHFRRRTQALFVCKQRWSRVEKQ